MGVPVHPETVSHTGGALHAQDVPELHPSEPSSSHSHVVQPSVHSTPGDTVEPSGMRQHVRSSHDTIPFGSQVHEPQPSADGTTSPICSVTPSCSHEVNSTFTVSTQADAPSAKSQTAQKTYLTEQECPKATGLISRSEDDRRWVGSTWSRRSWAGWSGRR